MSVQCDQVDRVNNTKLENAKSISYIVSDILAQDLSNTNGQRSTGSCHAVSRFACHPPLCYGTLSSTFLLAWTAHTHRHPRHIDNSWTEGSHQGQGAPF